MTVYLPILALAIILLTLIAMLALRVVRPAFAHHWLIAALGVLVAWPVVALTRLAAPLSSPLMTWQTTERFSASLSLLVDDKSWPMGTAAMSLVAVVILTAVARQQPPNWRAWAGSLTLGGFGLLAIWAGNALTLLLAWAALDLVEMLILFANLTQADGRRRVVVAFAARLGGLWLLMWAVVVSLSAGGNFSLGAIPPEASLYLLLAAGLRLGVLPLNVPFLTELPVRRGLGTTLRLVPSGASLTLLVRVADSRLPADAVLPLSILAALAALVGAGLWAVSADELSGRPFWVLGMASLAVASAVIGAANASLAWSLALILSGGVIFLYSLRSRFLLWIPALGFVCATGLPFTPAWEGIQLYAPHLPTAIWPVYLAAHALLLAGYLRHSLRPSAPAEAVERWVWMIYPLGVLILPATMVVVRLEGWMTNPPRMNLDTAWWGGAAALGGALLLGAIGRRGRHLLPRLAAPLAAVFSFQWLYRILWEGYQLAGQLLAYLNLILEGEGGLLWAMVLLILIVTLAPWGGSP